MPTSETNDGFAIHSRVLSNSTITKSRLEADRVAGEAGSACVRHLRQLSKHFAELAQSEPLRRLLPQDLRPVRSILFDKTVSENWPVAWHQDLTIAIAKKREVQGYGPWSLKGGIPHVQPPIALLQRMRTIRLHLDETPADNGALRVIPGSHRRGRITPEAISTLDKARAVTCVCHAGDLLVMSPLLLHASNRSISPSRRRVIHFEYAPADGLDEKLSWFESL